MMPDGVRYIARYTLPFTLGTKQKDHHPQLIEILRQTKELQKNTFRFCKNSNSCEPTWFELVLIQNDQVEWVKNLSTLQGGTYGKQVGHSPAKHAFYPGLISYSHQETNFCI